MFSKTIQINKLMISLTNALLEVLGRGVTFVVANGKKFYLTRRTGNNVYVNSQPVSNLADEDRSALKKSLEQDGYEIEE